ncbi:unnamed protein product, partial [Adineta steineri]
RQMASAPQLEIEKREGVPVAEDGTIGHEGEKAKATFKEQEEGRIIHLNLLFVI